MDKVSAFVYVPNNGEKSIYQSFFRGKKVCIIHGYKQCLSEANDNYFIIIIDWYKIESKKGIVKKLLERRIAMLTKQSLFDMTHVAASGVTHTPIGSLFLVYCLTI